MYISKFWKKTLSLLLCLVMIVTCLPATALYADAAETPDGRIFTNKEADPSTAENWKNFFGESKMTTEFAGGVYPDKSVFAEESDELPGVDLDNPDNFLVSLSAIASNVAITGHTASPTDTMLVLDVSGSMVNQTYEVGTIRDGNNYETADAINMSLVTAMIDATNDTISTLMAQNSNNRVGVVLYSGNTATNVAASHESATVILPLGRYQAVDGDYLEINTTWVTETLYVWRTGRWRANGEATYVPEGTNVHIRTKNNLKTEAGTDVQSQTKQVVGGTYIQNGLYKAMKEFTNVRDTVVPEGSPQAGAERQPVLVLMSDGAPTICTDDYSGTNGTDPNIGSSNFGNGASSQDADVLNRIAIMTQLTAAYVRGTVAEHYQETADDEANFTFLTLGLGTSADATATATLYPSGSHNDLKGVWDLYLDTPNNTTVTLDGNNFDGDCEVTRYEQVAGLNYVDRYFYADNAQSLLDSFQQIITEIELKAESYATLVEGSNPDLSGYVTFEDELGELMHVIDMKGILMADNNGNKVLYQGIGMAQTMNSDAFGTVEEPNERGLEFVNTVRERIPGITTSRAQQLINNAYQDQQLYYANENNWSNYIGWYADADGNYLGFWDKDSGYEHFPEGAVYANRSYGYLGVNGDSDMMHVVVQVRTELATLHQSVFFKIPASLLPTVQYRVTLNKNDPTVVDEFTREDAIPMQLVFEVGLRSDINSVNFNEKVEEHLAKGGHVHRNSDGTVTLYTNAWATDNDPDHDHTNSNNIPYPEDMATANVAEAHFHPARDNNRYYYTENTYLYNANGQLITSASRPTGTVYHLRYIYSANGRETVRMPVAPQTLAAAVQDTSNNSWYIPGGTIYEELTRFVQDKASNPTNTLGYSNYPAVYLADGKQDVYAFLGNNGSVTISPAQGIVLSKDVALESQEAGAPTEFLFTVKLSQAVENPVITDTDGNILTGIATVNGDEIQVTLADSEQVVISNIPTGTRYTVTEESTRFYRASSINNNGTVQAYRLHEVDFTNTAIGKGSLIVSKDVNYPEGFTFGAAHSNTEFTIQVAFDGDTTHIVAPTGATKDGNTYTLTLKDGQSVTFTDIPEGTTYTVTESTPSAGYALQEIRYPDTTKTIQSGDTDEAHVVNRYTLEPVSPNVTIKGTKTLETNDPNWGGRTFDVALLRIDNFADQDPQPTGFTATLSETSPSYEFDLSSISFDKAGIYYFRAVEVIPTEGRDENVAYDRTYGLFTITVADENADGALEIKAVNAYQNTGITGNSTEGWTLTKDFTNVVTSDRIYLNVEKQVLQDGQPITQHRGDITFGLFTTMDEGADPAYYALTTTDGLATIMVPVTQSGLQTQGTNGTITYYLREIAPAPANQIVGMNYDESWLYAVAITWDTTSNKAIASYAPITGTTVGEFTAFNDETFTFTHDNTYEADVHLDLGLSGRKTLNGRDDLGGRSFSFSLYHSTAAFVKTQHIQTVNNSGNDITFDDVPFTAPGVYYLVAEENASTLGGIQTDSTVYHITAEVEKYEDSDGTTRLRFVDGYPTVVPFGSATGVDTDEVNFNNLYTVTGSGDVQFGGRKILEGRLLAAEEFTIGLYRDEACTELMDSTTNQADGSFSFKPITYTAEDLGDNYATATYTYYVKEIVGQLGGVDYDENVYPVTVTVSHTNGQLVVTASDNATTLQIRNTYSARKVDTAITGSKRLVGNWDAVSADNQTFTFELYTANAQFRITQERPIRTESVTGNGTFSMGLSYEDGQEGLYYYVLKENISDRAGGIRYDAGEYHVTVNVYDPGAGQLIAQVRMYRPGFGNANSADFTNRYLVEPTSITLQGTKEFINTSTNTPMEMEDGDFTFYVMEGSTLVSTGHSKADGTIGFTPIQYTTAGTHTYVVTEENGGMGGVEYSTASFTVTVDVVDNGDGTLTATANYGSTDMVFRNTYTPDAAQVAFRGEKKLVGDWSAVSDSDKYFAFELYETDSEFNITSLPLRVALEPAGEFDLGVINYTAEDTHYYLVREDAGSTNEGIIHSQALYHITVTVTDDGNGQLIPVVSVREAGVTVSTEPGNAAICFVSNMVFENGYETDEATYDLEVRKHYEGADMESFEFELTADNNPKQTKFNDDGGIVTFDPLVFQTPGIYTATVKEIESTLLGLIRWDKNVYTITLHVEDDGKGQLFVNEEKTVIVSTKGDDDLTFHNTNYSVITKKDVFTVAEPTISIDGKTVDKGDILLYKVSYTNYDTVPVEIEITDVIPEHTTYVEGSADKGGSLTGNTLYWQLRDVAPGETVTVSFQVKVVAANVTVINGATVLEGGNTYETNETHNPVEEDVVVKDVFTVAEPTVSIDGMSVEKGDELLYKITYTNEDDFAAEVTITDVIPEYTTYVEGSADKGGVLVGDTLTWTLNLAAGASDTVSFKVKVTDNAGQTILNDAHAVEGNSELDSNQVSNPIEEDEIVKDVFHVAAPTVSIDQQLVELNDVLLYKITYTNSDDFDAVVTITDVIPEYTTYVAGSADKGGVLNGDTLTWTLNLAAGASDTVSFKVKVVATKITVINEATALEGNNTLHSNQVRNPVEEDLLVKDVFTAADDAVSIDGKSVNRGDELVYKVTYTNSDGASADVTVTDTIPQYTEYVEGSADNGGTFAGGKLTWTFTLGAGESKTVSFKVKVTGSDRQIVLNTASGEDGENKIDSNQVTNPIEDDVVVKDVFKPSAPTVSIDGKSVEKGDTLLYAITYTNTDDFAAEVTITDVIPQYTTYVAGSASDGGVVIGDTLTWTLTLAPGQSKTVTFQVKVTDYSVTVHNQAIAEEAGNKLLTNVVTVKTPAPPVTPQTGDAVNPALLVGVMALSTACLFVLILSKKHLLAKKESEE